MTLRNNMPRHCGLHFCVTTSISRKLQEAGNSTELCNKFTSM